MPLYSYKAIGRHGVETAGVLEASGKEGVVHVLSQRGITPIEIVEERNIISSGRPKEEDILFFMRNFGIALSAGVTVLEALEIMGHEDSKKSMRDMVRRVDISVRGGTSLSDAFIPFRRYFNPAFVGLLRAGEASGGLGKTFLLIAEFLRKEFSLHQRVRAAMIYPLVLVGATVGVVGLLVGFVLPKLSDIFAKSGAQLPFITKIVLFFANLFANVFVDIAIVASLVGFVYWLRNTKNGRHVAAVLADGFPLSRPVVRGVALVRFSRTLGNLLRAGVPMVESLSTTAESVGHEKITSIVMTAHDKVEGGVRLSEALGGHREYFPSVFVGLVRVGEETGKLSDILVDVSEFYDEEVDYLLKNMMSLLEPLILLVMGVIVGVIALSVLLPIYQLVGDVSH